MAKVSKKPKGRYPQKVKGYVKPDYTKTLKPNGRPPKFSTEEELMSAIFKYFEEIPMFSVPTKAGLLLSLDMGRTQYSEYRKKFPNTIRRAYTAIEDAWLQRLNGKQATGPIFYLKNAFKEDYKDRHETDMTVRTPKPISDVLQDHGVQENSKTKPKD